MKNPSSYIASLDGLRGLSILLVFVAHIGFEHAVPGGLGVTIFFFISGYLITNLLIDEFQKSGSVDLKLFYTRRMLRLYPPLLLMVALFIIYRFAIHQPVGQGQLFPALFYYENYYYFYGTHRDTAIGILWSLAVEEHFYLLFPLLFIFLFRTPKKFIAALILLLIVPLIFRFAGVAAYAGNADLSEAYCYLMTHTRFDSILWGCLASVMLYSGAAKQYQQFLSSKLVFIIAVAVQLICLVIRDDYFRNTFRYSLQGLSLFVIVPAIINMPQFQKLNQLFSVKPIVFIGRLSYSIYLMHMLAVNGLLFIKQQGHHALYYIAVVGATSVLALSSYYLIERPLGKLRKKLRSKAVIQSDAEFSIQAQLVK